MPFWIVLIILVSVIGGLITEYQKNKMKMMDRTQENGEEVKDLLTLVNKLKQRIENLEAIAAGEPEEFKTGRGAGMSEIEIDPQSSKEENRERISTMAHKERN